MRLRKEGDSDFDLLVEILASRTGVSTPGALAEVSIMGMQLQRKDRDRAVERNVEALRHRDEIHVVKGNAEAPEFKKVGAETSCSSLPGRTAGRF